ncbi:uncharacterized protein PITG_18029 [Phytophthora infestans T30-4]|uniref:Uncharacterized protein n=1 Tax=Phytophthora infestans (strain T30-4) TaxID=403677 RepID=D0NXJ7_PHYIT|nr:uncharacterized protein PITG_18029 [Phytophthora infestans T30-4]EEY67797.1 hypothetical protein PITG_18029 [Phytophthora infestans T30-4]|eukprot:XP_002997959.1 hypothetical protein PITG_18029 [Phytophthora infestans T30-4]
MTPCQIPSIISEKVLHHMDVAGLFVEKLMLRYGAMREIAMECRTGRGWHVRSCGTRDNGCTEVMGSVVAQGSGEAGGEPQAVGTPEGDSVIGTLPLTTPDVSSTKTAALSQG